MHCGVDEAGKGAVLGPMVVAAVGCSEGEDLTRYGFRDSKKLRPKQRSQLHMEIVSHFPTIVRVIPASEIDAMRDAMSMNALLAKVHAAVIEEIGAAHAFVDACDVNEERYGRMVKEHLTFPCEVIANHHADSTNPLVAAASIVAKVTRDREIIGIAREFGKIGSGYPSDPVTILFLDEYIRTRGKPPSCARWSWKTVTSRMEPVEQSTLSDF
ncbi:MAG: ribonuclease HII [Methanomicrobiales archaeon]|jgi:ribonuclease HII|nr:ribonuclease HII [Methanomicrobiales archaeon]